MKSALPTLAWKRKVDTGLQHPSGLEMPGLERGGWKGAAQELSLLALLGYL